jgi:hypothetical protein
MSLHVSEPSAKYLVNPKRKETALSTAAADWDTKTIGDVFELINGGQYPAQYGVGEKAQRLVGIRDRSRNRPLAGAVPQRTLCSVAGLALPHMERGQGRAECFAVGLFGAD